MIAAPLQQQPDLSQLPTQLVGIAERCLARNPEDRYPNCGELLAELQAVAPTLDAGSKPPVGEADKAPARRWWLPVGAAATLIGVVVSVIVFVDNEPAPSPLAAKSATPPDLVKTEASKLRHKTVTSQSAESGHTVGVISPDGTEVAYSHNDGVFVRTIASGKEKRLADNPSGELKPLDWLEKQKKIVCRVQGEKPSLITLSMTGEREALYSPAFMASVSPDNKQIAIAAADGLHIVAADRSTDRLVMPMPRREAQELGIRWNGEGTRLLVLRPVDTKDGRSVRVETISLPDGKPVLALEDKALVGQTAYRAALWLPDGRFVASITEPPPDNLGTNLWETNIDPRTGKSSGPLKRLTSWPNAGLWYASSSRDGTRVIVTMLQSSHGIQTATLSDERSTLQAPPKPLPSRRQRALAFRLALGRYGHLHLEPKRASGCVCPSTGRQHPAPPDRGRVS